MRAGSCGRAGDEASNLSVKEEANREKGLSCGPLRRRGMVVRRAVAAPWYDGPTGRCGAVVVCGTGPERRWANEAGPGLAARADGRDWEIARGESSESGATVSAMSWTGAWVGS